MDQNQLVSEEVSQFRERLSSIMKKAEGDYKKAEADWRGRMFHEIRGLVVRMEEASQDGKLLEAMAYGAFARYLLNMVAGP